MTDIDPASARALAESLRQVYSAVAESIGADNAASPLITQVTEHLGCPLSDVVVVEERYRFYEHAALQIATDLYLDRHSPGARWFGIVGGERRWESIINMLLAAMRDGSRLLGRPDYGTAAVGPEATIEVVQLGLVATVAPDGTPVVLALSEREDHEPHTLLTVLTAERGTATAVREEIDRLKREHDPLRGQVLSFGFSEHRDNEMLSFLPRPELAAEEVVLPEGRLEAIEEHIVGIAELADRLTAAGQHLRRGLLLYGPPGTGKTHTTRYLIGRLREHTAVLITGPAMRRIDYAVALARTLQPSLVIIEDVDLIAEDRGHHETSPLLFSLLDAMDGIGGDADVTFVLTTNRVEALERALVQRPGRVDLAVEVARPDAAARERLVRLYARDQRIDADTGKVVAATEGVTASFVKELMRRVILIALRAGAPALTDEHFDTALRAMAGDDQSLTRALLGSQEGSRDGVIPADPKDTRTPARLSPPTC
ncbi:ATP-binding protein [Nonomuraea bangladeshensis]|uniref:ATP-binding protein n=1 Tax=Nonomuraea bangladeshensis TaxID=404385 RepID=A0ABV3H5N7_9ACTN